MPNDWIAPSPDGAPVSLRMRPDPVDKYRLSPSQLQKLIEESERPIRQFLDKSPNLVRTHSLGALVVEVMKLVPGATDKSVEEVKYIIKDWAQKKGVRIPTLSTIPHPADPIPGQIDRVSAMAGLIKAVKDGVETAKSGVSINMGSLETKISISGATAKLGPFGASVSPTGEVKGTIEGTGSGGAKGRMEVGKDGASVSVEDGKFKTKYEVTWEGELKLSTSYDNFKFSGSISPKSWSITLTFNTAKMPPYPGAIGKIFGEGEKGVRGILRETARFKRIEDIPEIKDKIEPHLKPVKKAIGTAGALAGLKKHVSFGVKLTGPGTNADAQARAAGTSIVGVLTVHF